MSLGGKRILVLQAEYLVAVDLRALLQRRGAVVTVDAPDPSAPLAFDAAILDSTWGSRLIATQLVADNIPIVGYTGNASDMKKKYPHSTILNKPSSDDLIIKAVEDVLVAKP